MDTVMSRMGRKAFTLVELLVVIAIIALLLAILMPALQRVREAGRRAKCASGLHNNGIALMVYAEGFNGKFPLKIAGNPANSPVNIGNDGWDFLPSFNKVRCDGVLAKCGLTRQSLYCPSNWCQNVPKTQDQYWNTDMVIHLTGYQWLVQLWGLWDNTDPARMPLPLSAAGVPSKRWAESTYDKKPADQELLMDLVMADTVGYNASNGYPNGNFAKITVGGQVWFHTSSHLGRKPDAPAGGNILFVDGHVQWRNYSQMQLRINTGSPNFGGTRPFFWW